MVRVQLVGFSFANSPFRKPSFLRWELGSSESEMHSLLARLSLPHHAHVLQFPPQHRTHQGTSPSLLSMDKLGIYSYNAGPGHPFFSSILYAMQGYIKGQPLRANFFYPRNKFSTTLQQLEIQLSKGPGSHHPQVGILSFHSTRCLSCPKIVLQLFQIVPPYLYQMFLVGSCFSKDLS